MGPDVSLTPASIDPEHASTGRCHGIGVGPGDPELLTIKAVRVAQDCPVVAYFSAPSRPSKARHVFAEHLMPDQAELHFVYPATTGPVPKGSTYEELLVRFYDAAAEQLGDILDTGTDVAVLCEGDPLLHGSFMYLHNRLAGRYRTDVVPGVPAFLAATAGIGTPLVCRDEVLSVLTGTLDVEVLEERLRASGAAVIMKVGRHLERVRGAVTRAGLMDRAWYVELVSTPTARMVPLASTDEVIAPYFSMVVIPSGTAGER